METQWFKVLLIDEGTGAVRQLEPLLEQSRIGDLDLTEARSVERGLTLLGEGHFDLILLDISIADGEGLANIRRAQEIAPRTPLIVFGDLDDEALAIEAVHAGAQDYLVKDQLNGQLLGRAIRYAVERQNSESALLEAEQKYRGIFEHIVEGIFQTSPEGYYLSANTALARIYGYSSPDELKNNVTDIGRKLYVEPGRRAEFIQLMQEHDTVTDFESRIYRKDGSIIWIAENVRAIRDDRGRLRYYEGTVEDITQRKAAEENLRNSEALYHSLVETLPQNIFRKDLEKRFTYASRRFCETLGRPASEIIGKTDFDFFAPDLAEKYRRDDDEIMATGKTFEAVELHQPPGEEKIFVQTVKTPLYDAQGRIIGVQCIFWDITERKRAEEQVRLATAELARSREALRKKNEQLEEDLLMAREIQQTMLPQQYPTFPRDATTDTSNFQFCHRYLPTGAVGGDYFNVLALSDTEAGVFVCDVMGHGVRSALVAAMVRALVEELKPLASDPGQLLTQLNRDLCAILKHTGSPTLTTAFYMVADATKKELRYANAGHPKPLLIHHGTGEVMSLSSGDARKAPALGLFTEASYSTMKCPITENDLVMLFTDGLYEVVGPDEEMYSQEMLISAVRKRTHLPASQLFDELLSEIKFFAQGEEFSDDVCVVGMEVFSLNAGNPSLPANPFLINTNEAKS